AFCDLTHLPGCNRAGIHGTKNGLGPADDFGHVPFESDIDLLERRGIRSSPTAGQKERAADPLVGRTARLEALQPEPNDTPMVGGVIRFRVLVALDVHCIPSWSGRLISTSAFVD